MTLITLTCVFAGMAAGFRFRVLAILPLTLVTILATTLAGQHETAWAALGAIALNAVALQIGYLCGTYAQAVLRHPQSEAPAMAPHAAQPYKPARRAGIPAQ